MAHRLRQEDLPSGEAYLQRLKTQVFANDRTRYNFVLNRVQVWADIGSKTHLDKDALKLSVLQVIASLPNNTELIRDLNCLLPSQVAVFCPPSPAGKYVAVVTEDSGDIVELPISYDASSGECKFRVVFSSDDLRAAIPNNIEWNHVVQASIADGWTTSLLDLLTRQIEDASDDAEFRRLAFRRQTNLAKDHGLVPGHLLLKEVSSEREEVGPGTTIKSFAQRYRGKMGAISVCLRVPARIPDDDFGVEGENDRQYARNVLREVLTWYRLKHPNVLPLWGTHDNVFGDKRWSLVVPWMDNDDLLKYVKEHPHDMEFKLQAIYDIIEGLVYLHGQKPPIVHESLKARYILLDRNRRCRISHFACASLLADRGATITGTSGGDQSRWRAPEIRKAALDKARNKRAVDIFAFGCVVSEIYTGKKPFNDWSDSDIINKPNIHPYLPPTVPFKIERWTRKCWNERPEDRPTAMKLKEEIIPKDLQLTEASESLPLKFPSTLLDWVQSESMDFEFEPIRELDLEGLKKLVTTQDEADGVGMRVRKIVAAERAKIKEWEREQEHEHEHEQARQAAE